MHKKTKTDLITGLKTRTKAGRPDWDDLFQDIKKQDMGKVRENVYIQQAQAPNDVLSVGDSVLLWKSWLGRHSAA